MDELKQKAEQLGVTLTDEQLEQFKLLLTELRAWNEHTNLTAITEVSDIVHKHFLDSLSLLPSIPAGNHTLLDIGTGAGFPGLPLKICRPDLTITLLDSVAKKSQFHKHIIDTMHLETITTLPARAEELAHDTVHREHYDIVTARAVAQLSTLLEYSLPFLKVHGKLIAQKTYSEEEFKEASEALVILGAEIKEIIPISIDTLEKRHIIIIEKTRETPPQFPRRTGVPSKKPL